jgi:hypothetical protein
MVCKGLEDCKWRMDPSIPERYAHIPADMEKRMPAIAEGNLVTQRMVGGYMYLRSLIGPGALLYKFYDEPELIHDCMQTWLELGQAVISRHQEYVTIDEMVDRIFPAMQARGGYIPTCDHGVPEEVPYENYLHYRKRALDFA